MDKQKIVVVTSWSSEGYQLYGKDWIESATRNFTPEMKHFVVTDVMLNEDEDFVAFMERHAHRRMNPMAADYDYRQDLVRFAHKIFAIKYALEHIQPGEFDWLVWLDGDVCTKIKISQQLLDVIFPPDQDGVILSRARSAPHPECGFMGFNLNGKGRDFLEKYIILYLRDDVLKFPELHDSHIFMGALTAHTKSSQSKWLDLAPVGTGPHGLDAFEASPLHSYFQHRKGNRKFLEEPVRENTDTIARLTPPGAVLTIVTVSSGWWQPDAAAWLIVCTNQKAEDLKRLMADCPDLSRCIFSGYYTADPHGQHVDDTRFGINHVVPDLIVFDTCTTAEKGFVHVAVHKSWPHDISRLPRFTYRPPLPSPKETAADVTKEAYKTNFVIQTQNCAPNEDIRSNMSENKKLITEWIRHVAPHRNRAIIVSGGPSLHLPETMEQIRKEIAGGAYVFCVKHSHRFLLDQGIVPWACVLLDPRPHDGFSTHGAPRSELIPRAEPGVRYFVASNVHPSVTKRLLESGGRVIGWHAAVGAEEHLVLTPEEMKVLMGGGSSSAGRAVVLAWQFLGFQSIGLYGFDSCHLDRSALDMTARHQDGSPKYFEMELSIGGAGKTFITDRDILCQAQDFTRLLKEAPWIQWDAHGPGMVSWIYQNSKGRLPALDAAFG
jgi:hypothetical protein